MSQRGHYFILCSLFGWVAWGCSWVTLARVTFVLPYADPLVPGTLLRRYKRFLVDVRLDDGSEVTAHTANTGAMTGCADPGSRVYLSPARTPGRKLPFTLELVTAGTTLVGINTLLPNRLFKGAVAAGAVPAFGAVAAVKPEVKVGQRSRIDLLVTDADGGLRYVEIKNVTLAQDGAARFPDAVTARGLKHLRELEALARQGHRATILFAVQRGDCARVEPADDIDPEYGAALRQVMDRGVEALAHRLEVSLQGVGLGPELPVVV